MRIQVLRLITTWILGAIAGTLLIAATSPLFVRSYLPQQVDPVRGVAVPVPGSSFRWRSEGYATTQIGPLGMPGRTTLPHPDPDTIRVALWGDSQAEGVCVPDQQKLFAQIERERRLGMRRLTVLPLARSGDDAGDWLTQMPAVERELAIDIHVLMIVDLPDLLKAVDAPVSPPPEIKFESAIASRFPAFVIQAVRNLVIRADGDRRHLRFTVGPIDPSGPQDDALQRVDAEPPDWAESCRHSMQLIRQTSSREIVILYAPQSPSITGGRIEPNDPSARRSQIMSEAAKAAGFVVVDASAGLKELVLGRAALANRWPHGFQNGQFGSGHLNAHGYRVLARELVPAIIEIVDGKD